MAEYMDYDWKSTRISRDLLHQDMPYKKSVTLDKTTALQSLRNLIQQSRDLEFKSNIKQDEATLLKFLHAKKFNVEDACQLLQNYYWYRKKNYEIFKDFSLNASDIKMALENGLPTVLSSKDRKGRCVLVLTASNWDCSYNLMSVYRSLLFSLEFLITEVHNQANGFVVIVDWTEFTIRQSWNLKFGILKLMIEGLQNCFPARFKGIHFIGQSWFVETGLAAIKLLLNDKVKKRIYVHGNNLSTLHDYVARDILPAELGGEQPSHNPEIWLQKLVSSQSQK